MPVTLTSVCLFFFVVAAFFNLKQVFTICVTPRAPWQPLPGKGGWIQKPTAVLKHGFVDSIFFRLRTKGLE